MHDDAPLDRIAKKVEAWSMRIPLGMKMFLYGGLAALLGLILTGTLNDLMPGKLGLFLGRNSEAYVALLIVCAWIDGSRPRLQVRPSGWRTTILAGSALLLGGLLLRAAPWTPAVVTLNEALIGSAVVIPYLQQRRPSRSSTLALIGLSVGIPALGAAQNAFVTDMAEAFGVIIAVSLVVGVVDMELLASEPVRRSRNLMTAAVVLALMVIIHRVAPERPSGVLENTLFYIQRANEGLVVAIVMLCYYATRTSVSDVHKEPALTALQG